MSALDELVKKFKHDSANTLRQEVIADNMQARTRLWKQAAAELARLQAIERQHEELREGSKIIELMKGNSAIRIILNGRITRKLYWATDAQQWEVSSMESGRLTFPYKGGSLSVAIVALLEKP